MGRLLALLLALTAAAPPQAPTLHIKVTVVDADGSVRPVPRHALLISDNPVSSAPQRVVTTIDGTADIRLKPGNYTIESDEPLVFQGKTYEWTVTLEVASGRDTTLTLTPANAEVGTPIAPTGPSGTAPDTASALIINWQDSIVTIWSPTRRGSGFVIDKRGLIATNRRLVGNATSVEVQLSPTKKIAARVIAGDANKDVAILLVDAAAIADARPMTLGYARDGQVPVTEKEKIWAIEAPLDDRRSLASGIVSKLSTRTIVTDINLDERSAGVPLMNADGEVVAITTTADDGFVIPDVAPAAIRIDEARDVVAEAEKALAKAASPAGTPLPVESTRPFDDEALAEAAKKRPRTGAYQVAADDFDVSIITPVMLYAERHRGEERTTGRGSGRDAGNPEEMQKSMRALQDFANWQDYVSGYPPVVLLRVTPKLVEGFWTTVARGAAQTQGVSIPAMKHFKTGFSRLRLHCGDVEVTPVHPFRLEQRVSQREVVIEGLYAFDPGAFAPECKTVKLTLYSEKEPDKGDAKPIDPKIVQQVWDDFTPYRATPR